MKREIAPFMSHIVLSNVKGQEYTMKNNQWTQTKGDLLVLEQLVARPVAIHGMQQLKTSIALLPPVLQRYEFEHLLPEIIETSKLDPDTVAGLKGSVPDPVLKSVFDNTKVVSVWRKQLKSGQNTQQNNI